MAGSVLLIGFRSSLSSEVSSPVQVNHPATVRHVSLGIFEVVDCKKGVIPMSLKGSSEKYCLAAKPVVDETDLRLARATRNESGKAQLWMTFTLKAGQRMKEVTERLNQEHLDGKPEGKMALLIDGVMKSAPTVKGIISDELAIGDFSFEEAVQIADSLNATVGSH